MPRAVLPSLTTSRQQVIHILKTTTLLPDRFTMTSDGKHTLAAVRMPDVTSESFLANHSAETSHLLMEAKQRGTRINHMSGSEGGSYLASIIISSGEEVHKARALPTWLQDLQVYQLQRDCYLPPFLPLLLVWQDC